ncbi:Calcium/calmodulin-dependent protein kinase type II subunit gamma [Friedmanniomyces endolithicus]|nr:Calcium/calmodulin-dependent protein kinase type II subunit gamma [Friedmanniomyces endolithicus]KAK0269542.1 Calcium/calmodulin-dependent protein kinase type II subunit gamma [Friedmanniomyces endolithicus]KAK0973100.1 hypothetical protein LTR54_017422 [Friedmanniomyces endolithicus]
MDNTVYCVIGLLASPIDTTKQSQNDQYLLGPEEGPDKKRAGKHRHVLRGSTPELSKPMLAMRINRESMKFPHRGHRCGSDSDDCDVLLDTSNGRGVSGVHFRLALTGIASDATGPTVLWLINTSAQNTVEVDGIQLIRADQRALTKNMTHHLVMPTTGFRKINRTRTVTPRFAHKYLGWITLPDIPWQGREKYELSEHCAGSGAYSTVRTARRVSDHQTVAVKIIGDGDVAAHRLSPRHLQEREVEVMHSLDHTNVVRLLDYAFYDHEPYATLLVLEWATGDRSGSDFPPK